MCRMAALPPGLQAARGSQSLACHVNSIEETFVPDIGEWSDCPCWRGQSIAFEKSADTRQSRSENRF